MSGEVGNDPELLAGFFDESGESLAQVAELFIALEKAPGDRETVEAIFRPVHSLKGNSAFFGFMGIKRLAHEMESVLDHVRKGRLVAGREVVSALLEGLDELRTMLDRLRGGGAEVVAAPPLEALIARQRAVAADAGGDTFARSLAVVEEWLGRGGAAVDAPVRGAVEQLLARARRDLGLPPAAAAPAPAGQLQDDPVIAELRALVAATFTDQPDPAAVARMTELIGQLGAKAGDDRGRALAAQLTDTWTSCVEAAGYNDILRDFVAEQTEVLKTLPGFTPAPAAAAAPPTPAVPAAPAAPAAEGAAAAPAAANRAEAGKTVRVAESRIDTFLHHVGELLVVGDMFGHLQARVRLLPGTQVLARDFRRANDTFAQLSNKLQQAIMAVRKVPIRPQLTKVPRIVRDVAVAKGKEIEVRITGDEIEVDKSLVELLDAPLTHIARNAADHGVETPEKRVALGKPRVGTVAVTVQETGSSIVLSIVDDGAGLDLERIRAKAESLGLVAPGAQLSKQDLVNFIFASGLSTAEKVTDVSGRGVGMDVVRRMIDDAGGRIDIDTTPGQGTRFALTLPKGVTTQIIAGFMVRAGGQVLVLPLERVRETFRIRSADVSTLPGEAEPRRMIIRHDTALPLLSLSGLLGLAGALPVPAAVVIDSNHRRLALEVEALIGVRKVVLRHLEGLPGSEDFYAGAAMLGDGTVALILDPDALGQHLEPAHAG